MRFKTKGAENLGQTDTQTVRGEIVALKGPLLAFETESRKAISKLLQAFACTALAQLVPGEEKVVE